MNTFQNFRQTGMDFSSWSKDRTEEKKGFNEHSLLGMICNKILRLTFLSILTKKRSWLRHMEASVDEKTLCKVRYFNTGCQDRNIPFLILLTFIARLFTSNIKQVKYLRYHFNAFCVYVVVRQYWQKFVTGKLLNSCLQAPRMCFGSCTKLRMT